MSLKLRLFVLAILAGTLFTVNKASAQESVCEVYKVGNPSTGSEKYITISKFGGNFLIEKVSKLGNRSLPISKKTFFFDFIREEWLEYADGSKYRFITRGQGRTWIGVAYPADGESYDLDLSLEDYKCGEEPI